MESEAVIGLIGLSVGFIGAALGLGVMVAILLGFLNRFLVVRPRPGIAALSKSELFRAILALNDERRPWGYRPIPEDKRADLVAEWKIADARWWGAFNKNGFSRSYRAFVTLDEGKHELRITEESSTVSWSAGAQGIMPAVSWQRSFFKGVILFERAKEVAYGIKDEVPPSIGEIYKYDFNPWRVKGPLLKLAIENGWSYCPVVHRFQLGRKDS